MHRTLLLFWLIGLCSAPDCKDGIALLSVIFPGRQKGPAAFGKCIQIHELFGTDKVLGNQPQPLELVQLGPDTDNLWLKPMVRKGQDKHPSGPEYTGHILENLKRLGQILN